MEYINVDDDGRVAFVTDKIKGENLNSSLILCLQFRDVAKEIEITFLDIAHDELEEIALGRARFEAANAAVVMEEIGLQISHPALESFRACERITGHINGQAIKTEKDIVPLSYFGKIEPGNGESGWTAGVDWIMVTNANQAFRLSAERRLYCQKTGVQLYPPLPSAA